MADIVSSHRYEKIYFSILLCPLPIIKFFICYNVNLHDQVALNLGIMGSQHFSLLAVHSAHDLHHKFYGTLPSIPFHFI